MVGLGHLAPEVALRKPKRKPKVERIASIPDEVTLSPQAQPPPGGHGQDRSAQRGRVRELSWARFEKLVAGMARQIRRSVQPDAVVGVAHGGVFVGGLLAEMLEADFFPVRISRRSRDQVMNHPRLYGEIPKELKGRRVLVVDDVASSGDTLELAKAHLLRVRAKETRTATLVAREHGYAPDWSAIVTDDLVVFPWDYATVVEDRRFES